MQWWRTQTDRDWDAAHRISEQIRHERLERQASIISQIETTPANEPVPVMTMDRYRKDRQERELQSILDIMGNEPDEIPGL